MIKRTKTQRGFCLGEFRDLYDAQCSIQESSLADVNAIWIGIDNPDPKILASRASEFGIKTKKTTGWIDFPVHQDVLINTRMHLSQEQVAELIPILQHFVDSGNLFNDK
jgi:hypothetical protein